MTHKIDFETNTYSIFDDDANELLSIDLTKEPGNQIIIKTEKEIYSGPIELLSFSGDI